MHLRERITCSALALVFCIGLGSYVSPESVRADAHSSFVWRESSQAATKPNQPSIAGDQDSVVINYGDSTALTDAVRYTNLSVGKTYTIEGILYELVVDNKGTKTVNDTGISNSQTFTVPDSPRAKAGEDGETKLNSGVISLQFSVEDFENMRGKDYVIFETLKDGDSVIAKLDRQNDTSRYVRIPVFSSSLVSGENGTKVSLDSSGTSAKAKITYRNLIPEKNYYCHIRLIKQAEAGAVFTLGEDSFKFVPAKANDSIEKSIQYFITPKSGDCVQLLYDISTDDENKESGTEVFIYRMNDNTIEDNKLYVTDFSVALNDTKTGTSLSEYSKKATSRLNLSYANLPYGEFKITTSLFDASTNKVLKGSDGKPCQKTESFYPIVKNASYSTDFKFDSTALAGHQLYTNVKVTSGNKVIYSANSRTDNNRIYIAAITSKDLSFATWGTHKADLDDPNESIKDLISYKNLLSGKIYNVESVLINAKTKKQVKTSPRSVLNAFNTSGEFSNVISSLAYSGILGSILHSHVNLYMDDVLVASSRSVPKNYTGITIPKPTPTPKPTKAPTPKPAAKSKPKKKATKKKKARRGSTVYWTEYGECYHRRLSCISRSRYYYKGTVSEARSWGYRPCKKCCR